MVPSIGQHKVSYKPRHPASPHLTATQSTSEMCHSSIPIPNSYDNASPYNATKPVPSRPQSHLSPQCFSRSMVSRPSEPDLFRPLPPLPPQTGASMQKGSNLLHTKPRNTSSNSSMPVGNNVASSRRVVISPDAGPQAGMTPTPVSSSVRRGSGVSSWPTQTPPQRHEPDYSREESLLNIQMPPYLSTMPSDADMVSECSWDSQAAIPNSSSQSSPTLAFSSSDPGGSESQTSASNPDTNGNSDYLYDEIDQLLQQMSQREQPVLRNDGDDAHQDSLVFPLPSPYEYDGYEDGDDGSVLSHYSQPSTTHSDVVHRPKILRRSSSDFTLSEVVFDGPALFAERPIYQDPCYSTTTLYGNNKHGEYHHYYTLLLCGVCPFCLYSSPLPSHSLPAQQGRGRRRKYPFLEWSLIRHPSSIET
jgi:hypothetical protein